MSRRRQRSSTTPLEDAKEAIENSNNSFSEDDRYQMLSDSLAELSEQDRLSLVKPCIYACWSDGLTSVIADIPVNALETVCPICTIIMSRITESQMVRLVKPLLLKGCGVNHRLDIDEDSSRHYVVRQVDGDLKCSLTFPATPNNAAYSIHLSQCVVQNNLLNVLKLLLPKFDKFQYNAALIEAFGSNRQGCCETLVDYILKHPETTTDFNRALAITLCCMFGRASFLEILLAGASDKTKRIVRFGLVLRTFCVIPPDFEKLNAFEAAVIFNHPRCVNLLLANQVEMDDDDAVVKVLDYCARNAIYESSKEFIAGSPNLSSSVLKRILESFLKTGGSAEIISILIERLKKAAEGSQEYLDTLMSKCAANHWWRGLLVLADGGKKLFGNGDEARRDAQRVLNGFAVLNFADHQVVVDILKSLSIFCLEMDLRPALFAAVRNENLELLEFFLSLNNDSVSTSSEDLKQETENEECLKLMDDASLMKVKLEAEDAEDDEEDEEEEEEEVDKNSAKKKPSRKTTKAKQRKAKAAKASSAKLKPAAKK